MQSFVSMFVNILVLKWVLPYDLGIWQSVSVFLTYVPILGLGVIPGLSREIPYLFGQGKENEAKDLAIAARTYSIIVSFLILFVAIISYVIYQFNVGNSKIQFAILVTGCIASITIYKSYLLSTYRSANSFNTLAVIYYVQSVFLLACIPLIYIYKYWGLMVYHLADVVVLVYFMNRYQPLKVTKWGNLKGLKSLFKVGFPMFIATYIRTVSQSFPRLFILSKNGVELLGLFSPVMAVMGVCNLLPATISQFSYPRFTYIYGKTGNAKNLWHIVWKIHIAVFLIAIPCSILAWYLLPGVMSFFPKYVEAVLAMRLIVISTILSATIVTYPCLYSIKAYYHAGVFVIIEFLSFWLFSNLALHRGGDILTNMAVGIFCSQMICIISNFLILRHALFSKKFNLNR